MLLNWVHNVVKIMLCYIYFTTINTLRKEPHLALPEGRTRESQIQSHCHQFPITLTSAIGGPLHVESTLSRSQTTLAPSCRDFLGPERNGECQAESHTSGLLIADWKGKQVMSLAASEAHGALSLPAPCRHIEGMGPPQDGQLRYELHGILAKV